MKPTRSTLVACTLLLLIGSYLVLAQQPAAPQGRGAQGPPQPMSFFVTSVGHVSSPRGAECASELRM